MNRSRESTGAPGDLLPARWFDGLSSKAQPVMVGLQPTPKGPSLVLHPMAASGAAPRVFTHDQVAGAMVRQQQGGLGDALADAAGLDLIG